MIRSRLSYVRFNLKILTLLLPACSYFIAVKVRFGFNLFFSGPRLQVCLRTGALCC